MPPSSTVLGQLAMFPSPEACRTSSTTSCHSRRTEHTRVLPLAAIATPGSTFIDHLLRYEADPECKMLVLLGEVGGIEEYRVIDAVKSGKIKKPIVAWAIGTCAKMFTTEVQFGHAGSMANSALETADAKNTAMKAAGIIVPETFEDLPDVLRECYEGLVSKGVITPKPEREPSRHPDGLQVGSRARPHSQACCVYFDYFRRARSGAPLRRYAHLGCVQGGNRPRWVSSACSGSSVVSRRGRPSSLRWC